MLLSSHARHKSTGWLAFSHTPCEQERCEGTAALPRGMRGGERGEAAVLPLGRWRRIVSWLLVPSVAVLVVEATHLCVKGLRDVERESIPWPLSLLRWRYVGSCVRGTSGGVMLLLVRRAKLRSIG